MEVDYESKPRRELQALCKQHGLPANLTNARMAENLASMLQKANSEENKPKGCLKGSGGSSAEEGGRLLPKKVSFSLHEVGVPALPERRRSSRRKSVVGFAPKEVTEGVLEAKIELEVRKTSKRYHCTSPDRNGEVDLATNFPCPGGIPLDEKHDGSVPITRNLRSRVITVEGSKALQADIKVPRRTVTRSNSKKAQVEVVASIPEVHPEEMKSRSDDGLVNKGRSKRQKCGNATVKIDERHDNFTKSQNLLNTQESGTSVAPVADETVAIKKIRKLGRNKKTSEATDVTDPSIEHTTIDLRRSGRNSSLSASAKNTVVVPVTKSSVVHEPNKEIKRPNHNAPELQICVEKLVHITAKAKKLHNLQIGQVINEPPNEDSYVDCTVGDGRETHLGQKHVEELQRKSKCTRSGLVLEANKNDGRLRAKKRTKSSRLDDDSFSHGKVEVTSRSDSTELLDEKGSSCRHEDVSEQTVEGMDSHIDQGPFHPCLSLFATEDISTINAHNSFFGEEQPIHKHENSTKKTAANELKVAEEKNFLTKEVEPVAFDLLDTKKMDSNVGFSCSSQVIPSADWSVKNVTLEGGSSHSGLDSTNKVKDRQGSQGFVGESAFKRTCDNQMLVRDDNDFLSNNSIDVSIKLKDASSYSEEVMKEDTSVLETECMSNTIYSKDSKDGDGLNMCLNICDAPIICHREEHSHVSDTHTCSLNQPKTITLQVNGVGENTSNTSSCDSDLKDKAALPLTVFACNDLVDFFDQPKISRNSIGSYGVASMASSSAEYEEFCGLKDTNDTNVPCDSLHAYEVVKQEGILQYSSSNCEITANSVEHSQGEQRRSQESCTAVPDVQSCNIVQDDDRCIVNKFGSCSRCVINCNFSEQAIDQRVLSTIRPEISSEIQKTPLEVKVINIPSSGDNLYKNQHDDNSRRVDLIKPSDHRELSGFRSYGRNSYSEGFGMQGGKSTSLPEKSGGAITVIFEQMKGLQFDVAKEVPSELKLFVDYEAQALLQDELNLEKQQVSRTGSSLSTVASAKSEMASDALLSDDERRHDGTKGVDLPSNSGFKDKRIGPAITEINDVLGSSCKDTFDHSPVHLAQSSGKFQGDIWATISTSNSVRKIKAVCNADSPSEEKVVDNLEVINMEDHQPQMAVSPFCVVSSIEGNACFLNDEFKQPKHANSSESANAIEEDAPNKLSLSLSVPKDTNIVNNDDLSISRVEKKSEFLAPFSGGLKEVKEVAVIHDRVENSGLNASYGFSNCESKHAKSLSNGSALAIKSYMESVHNLDEMQNKFQASLDADSKITGIPVNEGGLKGRKSYGTTASSVKYACCTNVDLPTDNVKDEENNLNGPSKILMQEVASRMHEDDEEIEVTMRQETENWLDEEDAQEYLPLKNESENRSLELTASCKTIHSFERQCIEDHDEADIGHPPKNEHDTISNIDNAKTRGNLTSPTLGTVETKSETSMPNLDSRNLLSSAVDEGGEHLCTSPSPVSKVPLVSVDKNSEILNICQIEPDLTRFEEAETDKDNADGCNVSPSTNEHYDGKVDKSSSKSPNDGSSVQSSLNYLFGIYQHSKTEEVRIATDVPLMFSGDLFHVERTQPNDANHKSNQKKFSSDYSKGRSAATNMVGEIENTKNEQEEQTIDGTMDFEYLTRLEASAIFSDSTTVDELENQVTVPFDVESTPRKDTTIENEDNECIENTSEKYLATQHLVEAGNRNDKDIETPDMASSQNASSRCVTEESESAIGIKDLFEDLSATTMSVSSPGASAMGEVISENTNDTPKMTIGSFEVAFDACSALYELEPVGVLGTLGDTLIMPTEEVSSNSTNHLECEMKNAQEFSTEKKSNICPTINRSIEIEAQTSNIEIGSVAVSCEVKPVSSLGTPKDTPVLPNEQENRDAGIPICSGAAVMFDQITKCKKDVAQENTAEDINLTSKTIIISSDVAPEKLSAASTTGEEQLSTTEAEIVQVNNIILEEKCGDGGSKVQELLVETINTNKLSQPTQGIAPAYSSSEHSSFTNDDPTESPELTIEWEEEFSRKLIDFSISSAIKTSKPAAMPGKENAPAIRKDMPQMHPVDGSAIKSSRKALKTINHN